MQTTTNYSFLLAEGTDLVNYLTQTNPNFSSLDTLIKSVSDATVTNATEVTVGTAHAITRSLTDAPVIRFTATSNWTTGDTMTIDGNSVTPLKTDGTTLKTGDYIIGSSVLGILDSTRFTVLVSSAAPTTASEITYDNTSSHLSATNTQNAIDELDSTLFDNSSTSITTYLSSGVDCAGFITQIGNIILVLISGSYSPAAAGNTGIAVLPSALRPSGIVKGAGMMRRSDTSLWYPTSLCVNSSGKIYLDSSQTIDFFQGILVYTI